MLLIVQQALSKKKLLMTLKRIFDIEVDLFTHHMPVVKEKRLDSGIWPVALLCLSIANMTAVAPGTLIELAIGDNKCGRTRGLWSRRVSHPVSALHTFSKSYYTMISNGYI